eukprot:scaffold1696_cov258-Pinguiococcus_pyrenoidosus.AAC.17
MNIYRSAREEKEDSGEMRPFDAKAHVDATVAAVVNHSAATKKQNAPHFTPTSEEDDRYLRMALLLYPSAQVLRRQLDASSRLLFAPERRHLAAKARASEEEPRMQSADATASEPSTGFVARHWSSISKVLRQRRTPHPADGDGGTQDGEAEGVTEDGGQEDDVQVEEDEGAEVDEGFKHAVDKMRLRIEEPKMLADLRASDDQNAEEEAAEEAEDLVDDDDAKFWPPLEEMDFGDQERYGEDASPPDSPLKTSPASHASDAEDFARNAPQSLLAGTIRDPRPRDSHIRLERGASQDDNEVELQDVDNFSIPSEDTSRFSALTIRRIPSQSSAKPLSFIAPLQVSIVDKTAASRVEPSPPTLTPLRPLQRRQCLALWPRRSSTESLASSAVWMVEVRRDQRWREGVRLRAPLRPLRVLRSGEVPWLRRRCVARRRGGDTAPPLARPRLGRAGVVELLRRAAPQPTTPHCTSESRTDGSLWLSSGSSCTSLGGVDLDVPAFRPPAPAPAPVSREELAS